MEPNNRVQFLVVQYRECLSYIKHLDVLVWQTPSMTMAINTFLGILYLGHAKTFWSKLIILLASLAFTFVAWIAIQKHRFHQMAKNIEYDWIQNELLIEFKNVREIRLRTDRIKDDQEDYPIEELPRDWFTSQSAYVWLWRVLFGTILIILFLIGFEISRACKLTFFSENI